MTEADVRDEAALSSLYERVEDAAARICTEGPYGLSALMRQSSACTRATVAASIERAGIAPLTAYYAALRRPAGETTTLAAAQ